MSQHTDVKASDKTEFYDGAEYKPVRIGVYRVSMKQFVDVSGKAAGGSYEYWNGHYWEPYKNWGQMSNRSGFLWQGLVSNQIRLPQDHVLFSRGD